MPTNVYINNLSPRPLNITVTFPDNVIAAGDWGVMQSSLQGFDVAHHEVAWVDRDIGIKHGVSYTMLINVYDAATQKLLVSANIGLEGTLTSSEISIGAQNSEFGFFNESIAPAASVRGAAK